LDNLKSDEGSVDGSGNLVFEEDAADIMDSEEKYCGSDDSSGCAV